jgi:hypothetical protein
MVEKNEINLAKKIVRLDLLRDELYEELSRSLGSRAQELLRLIQNS